MNSFEIEQVQPFQRRSDNASFTATGGRRELNDIERSWLLRPEEPTNLAPYRFSICRMLTFITITTLIVGLVLVIRMVPEHPPPPPPAPDHYQLALHVALRFFHAQRSGVLPLDNNVSWRGDSCLNDGVSAHIPYTKDLVGGYYEGGDAIKFNLPTSFGLTILSWSVIEYHTKYEAAGELLEIKEIIRWGTDYLLKNFDSSSEALSEIVYQVGIGSSMPQSLGVANDRTCWMRPEDIMYERPVARCDSCSDVAAEMAAALAAASIVFREDNDIYSDTLAHGASLLFEFAKTRKDKYSFSGSDASYFYNSTGYWDELLWAGTWLFFATGEKSHLEYATEHGLAEHATDFGILNWDSKLAGAQVLLTRLRMFLNPGYPSEEMLAEFHSQTQAIMCSYLPDFTTFNRTRGGLILLSGEKPAPLQYVVTAAFLATVFGDYLKAFGAPGWYCGPTFYEIDVLRNFSEAQVGYILGKNPRNMSYIVGYGDHYPTHVHHRGASIPLNATANTCEGGYRWRDSKAPNPNVIIGAMVAGPDKHDNFYDDRTNNNYTEPTISSNAGLIAALVALSGDRTIGVDKNKMFIGIPPMYPPSPSPPKPWKP